jgi:hypothetical protein
MGGRRIGAVFRTGGKNKPPVGSVDAKLAGRRSAGGFGEIVPAALESPRVATDEPIL